MVAGVLGGCIVLLVATHAFRGGIRIIASCMAFGTVLYVMALCQREKVVVYHGRGPARFRGMTVDTVRGKAGILVVRVLGGCIVLLVATHAFGGGIRIIACGVAFGAVLDVVPLREREKIVVDTAAVPSKSQGVVAFGTIC